MQRAAKACGSDHTFELYYRYGVGARTEDAAARLLIDEDLDNALEKIEVLSDDFPRLSGAASLAENS